MDDDFDASLYTRSPKLDVAGAVALSIKLLAAVPKNAPVPVKKAAKALRQKVLTLQSVWKARDRVEKRVDPRPLDVLADHAMAHLVGRIEDYAGLPQELYPLASRAAALLATLFPTGLTFLKQNYPSQWAETQKRLERIDEEGLADDIDKIAGPEFLSEVRRVHALYGDAIGVTRNNKIGPLPNLSTPLREVSAAITLYSMQLATIRLDDEATPDMRQAAREALRPLDEHRADTSRRETSQQLKEATPESEVPEVPA